MRGFPGATNPKLVGAGTPAPALPLQPSPLKLPNLPSPTPINVIARPSLPVPMIRAASPPPPPPVVRPTTVAAIARNLQVAVGPEPLPATPTRQGFPGFVSRNFNQVSQHQPIASSAGLVNNLVSLLASPAPPAPERRAATRPSARPAPAAPASARRPDSQKQPAVTRPTTAVQAPEGPLKSESRKSNRSTDRPHVSPREASPKAPVAPALEPAATAAEQTKSAPRLSPGGQTKPAPTVQARLPEKKPSESIVPNQETTSSEARVARDLPKVNEGSPQSSPQPRHRTECGRLEELEPRPKFDLKTAQPPAAASLQAPVSPTLESKKLTQSRSENTDLKLSEIQPQQLSALPSPLTREQIEMAQQAGAGLTGGGGAGGGGQGQQQHQKQRPEVEVVEETQATENPDALGETNLRVLSCELREAIFNLRDPIRKLGIEPRPVRRARLQRQLEEEAQRARHDCPICGQPRNDGEGCAGCASYPGLRWIQLRPRFIPYRVFLTHCPAPMLPESLSRPVSEALFRLSDFNPYPGQRQVGSRG